MLTVKIKKVVQSCSLPAGRQGRQVLQSGSHDPVIIICHPTTLLPFLHTVSGFMLPWL